MRRIAISAAALVGACAAPLPPDLPLAPQDRERVPRPVGAPPPPPVDAPPVRAHAARNAFGLSIGAAHWADLGSLSTAGSGLAPNQFGAFDDWGLAFDVGYERAIGEVFDAPFWLGIEWGVGSFGNDGQGVSRFSDRLEAQWMRFTPTARLMVPIADGVQLVPGGGIGAYYLDFRELDRGFFGYTYDSRRIYDDWTFGGFAALGLELQVFGDGGSLRIENELHWLDFDGLGGLLPAETSVGGPIYVLQIGGVFRF